MPNASGLFKQVSIKRNAGAYGAAAGTTGFQLLRRTSSTLDLNKETYQSAEIRPDMQVADFRHGVRRVAGAIGGELSPGTYADIFAAMLKRDFTAGASAASLSITIAGSGPTYTVTRAAGSWLTDGFKLYDVFRLTAGTFNVANSNKNLMIVALTATIATVIVLNGSALVAEGPIASATAAVTGKKTYTPTSGHTDVDFNVEHWYADIAQSELFTGVKFAKADLSLPPTGITNASFEAMGQDMTTATARYGASPTAVTTTTVTAAVNGALVQGGAVVAIVTGLQLTLAANYSGDPVVGSNTIPALFAGRVIVGGQFTAYFPDATLRNLFVNETETSLAVALTSDNSAASAFVAFSMPRIKVGGAAKNDGEGAVTQTLPFQALFNSSGGAGTSTDQTTLVVQDSAAP